MKINRPLSLLFVFLALVFVLNACKKDDSNPVASNGDELVGTWALTKITVISFGVELTPADVGVSATFVLRSDRTYTVTFSDSTGTEVTNGNWSSGDGKVTLTDSEGTPTVMPYSLSGNVLTVETVYDLSPYGLGAEQDVKLELTKQ